MKTYLNSLFFLAILLLGVGCSNKPKPYTIVFCDFTSSIDTLNSVENIKNNALQILSAEATNTNIEFYIISKDDNSPCLYTSSPLKDNSKPSEKKVFQESLPNRKKRLRYILDSVCNSGPVSRTEPNSCIISAIARAIKYFNLYQDHQTVALHLYILSDMMECSPIGKNKTLCIEPDADIKKQIELIPPISDSSISFKQFRNVGIYAILSTNKKHKGYGPDFDRFWAIVFKRYGYDSTPYIKVQLPNEIANYK